MPKAARGQKQLECSFTLFAELAWEASLVTILWLNALKTALNLETGATASSRCLPAHPGPKALGHFGTCRRILQGQLCQERCPWEGSAHSAPSVVAIEGHSEILVWNMEEPPPPEKEVACPGSVVGFLFGSVCLVWFQCLSHAGDSF